MEQQNYNNYESQEKSNNKLYTIISILLLLFLLCLGIAMGVTTATGPMVEGKTSIFGKVSDTYTLDKEYTLTREDYEAIGKDGTDLILDYACCIDLNGHVLDLNGYDFKISSSDPNKVITFKNGTIINGGSLSISADAGEVVLQNIKLDCPYTVNTTNTKVYLVDSELDANKINVVGGMLCLNNAQLSGNLDAKSNLGIYDNSTVGSISADHTSMTIYGQYNGTITLGEDADVRSEAILNEVVVNGGAKLLMARVANEAIGSVNPYTGTVTVKGGEITAENCTGVGEFNVLEAAKVQISGEVNKLNVDNEKATISINKCAIVDEININKDATVDFAGTSSNININAKANLNAANSSYIKELVISQTAGAANVTMAGKSSIVENKSADAKIAFTRDSIFDVCACVDESKIDNKSHSAGELNPDGYDGTNKKDYEDLFVMPIKYVDSDCTGDGYINYSKGGDKKAAAKDITEEAIKEVGHAYVLTYTENPTTEKTGYARYTCPECGDYYDVVLPIRKVIFDAPTLIDLFGLDLKAGEYDYSLNDGTYYVLDNNDSPDSLISKIMASTSAVSSNETTVENSYDILYIDKAYIHVTVEKNEKTKEVKLYGDIEVRLNLYFDCDKTIDEIKVPYGKSISQVLKETYGRDSSSLDIKVVMDESIIYLYYDGDAAITQILDVYQYADQYLAQVGSMYGIDITLDDIVNILNGTIKVSNILDQYDAAFTLLANTIKNRTNLAKIFPQISTVYVEDDVYTLDLTRIFDSLEQFGNQSLAAYFDSIVGQGTLSGLIDFAEGLLDREVYSSWEELVILASNGGITEKMLLEDLDTILSVIVNDILPTMYDDKDPKEISEYFIPFYDAAYDTYTVEYLLQNYAEYKFSEIILGERTETNATTWDENYNELKDGFDGEISSVETFLYDTTVYHAIAYFMSDKQLPITEELLKEIVKETNEIVEYFTIQWTYATVTEDNVEKEVLETISIDLKKDVDATSVAETQGTQEPVSFFTLKYNCIDKEIEKLMIDIAYNDILTIKYDSEKNETLVNLDYNGLTFNYVEDNKKKDIDCNILDIVKLVATYNKVTNADTSCDLSAIEDFKFKSLNDYYNELKADYTSIDASLEYQYRMSDHIEHFNIDIAIDCVKEVLELGFAFRNDDSDPDYSFTTIDLATLPYGYIGGYFFDDSSCAKEDCIITNADVYFVTKDTKYETHKTYYTRTGEGTEESPYVYSLVASGSITEFAEGTVYYEKELEKYYCLTTDTAYDPGHTYYVLNDGVLVEFKGESKDFDPAKSYKELNNGELYRLTNEVIEDGDGIDLALIWVFDGSLNSKQNYNFYTLTFAKTHIDLDAYIGTNERTDLADSVYYLYNKDKSDYSFGFTLGYYEEDQELLFVTYHDKDYDTKLPRYQVEIRPDYISYKEFENETYLFEATYGVEFIKENGVITGRVYELADIYDYVQCEAGDVFVNNGYYFTFDSEKEQYNEVKNLTEAEFNSNKTSYYRYVNSAKQDYIPVEGIKKFSNSSYISYYELKDEYKQTSDTSYNSKKKYYTRTGEGTEESPYVYALATITEFANDTVYYEYSPYSETTDVKADPKKTYYVIYDVMTEIDIARLVINENTNEMSLDFYTADSEGYMEDMTLMSVEIKSVEENENSTTTVYDVFISQFVVKFIFGSFGNKDINGWTVVTTKDVELEDETIDEVITRFDFIEDADEGLGFSYINDEDEFLVKFTTAKYEQKYVEVKVDKDSKVDSNITYYIEVYREYVTVSAFGDGNKYYEYNSETKSYFLTEDDAPVATKTYYYVDYEAKAITAFEEGVTYYIEKDKEYSDYKLTDELSFWTDKNGQYTAYVYVNPSVIITIEYNLDGEYGFVVKDDEGTESIRAFIKPATSEVDIYCSNPAIALLIVKDTDNSVEGEVNVYNITATYAGETYSVVATHDLVKDTHKFEYDKYIVEIIPETNGGTIKITELVEKQDQASSATEEEKNVITLTYSEVTAEDGTTTIILEGKYKETAIYFKEVSSETSYSVDITYGEEYDMSFSISNNETPVGYVIKAEGNYNQNEFGGAFYYSYNPSGDDVKTAKGIITRLFLEDGDDEIIVYNVITSVLKTFPKFATIINWRTNFAN